MDEYSSVYDVRHYLTPDGRDVYLDWLSRLRDTKVSKAVVRRIVRVELGNFGDHKFCRDGVWELRIDLGPGLRIYYACSGNKIVLLLCGGDKSTQQADIHQATIFWKDWQARSKQ